MYKKKPGTYRVRYYGGFKHPPPRSLEKYPLKIGRTAYHSR
jgi:hypothetical protein